MPHKADPEKTESGHLAAVIQSSSPFPSRKVLDVGCGNGNLTREFAERSPCDVFGIDPGFGNLQQARSGRTIASVSITFAAAMGEALPFADGTFDVAALTSSL
jgi:2-polyprenyl-6-hydroxyphenyl methylase/3-demethylubiquinone-9 3-methyltransferase